MSRNRRKWDELDIQEKLGYYWVALFALLCIATAVAIFIPITESWVEEAEYSLSEEGQEDDDEDYEDDEDYDYDESEDEEDYEDDEDSEESEE